MSERSSSRAWTITTISLLACVAAACSREKSETKVEYVGNPAAVAPPSAPATVASATVADAQSIEQSCTRMCENSRHLKCPNTDNCMKYCTTMAAGPCIAEYDVFFKCLAREPANRWGCDVEGNAGIDGSCGMELQRVLACEAKAEP